MSYQVVPGSAKPLSFLPVHQSLRTKARFIFASVPSPLESRTSEPEVGGLGFYRHVKASSLNRWILTRAEVS